MNWDDIGALSYSVSVCCCIFVTICLNFNHLLYLVCIIVHEVFLDVYFCFVLHMLGISVLVLFIVSYLLCISLCFHF